MIGSVKCLARIQKTSEDTTIKNTISVDNLFKYIYTLISAVVSFESKLVRTSIEITRDTIIYHDFSNFADHAGKRNRSIVVFGHDMSSFLFNHRNKYISNHAVGKRTVGKETGHTLAEKVS